MEVEVLCGHDIEREQPAKGNRRVNENTLRERPRERAEGRVCKSKRAWGLGLGDPEKQPLDFVKRSAEDLPGSSQNPAWEGHTWEMRQRQL